ncbi:hypothetical protein CC85DRAFT_203243 [Cutaneotrichosporon oleaginosum]|uniref:Acid protease n=1 Tax=Cutaneotrichosporon oleaginosum TaxID=879819 RepID=A0A0J0XUI7_9TREE|nr:uncharacterized protein CC85DRAFT_203243 [Cutaneotrichosporon oleaginosum]KLT44743.1 hypothetical protein CC85DRAFT_203243 [Cutaneotrichosporon oleaginosum]TXT07729.1 hypothetical protein COLE_04653 [Cutaneotrichosporon oleaginosum]
MDPFATITMLGALRALMLALMLAVPIHGAATSVVLDSYSLNALYRPQVNGSLANTGAWNASFTGSPWSTKLFGAHGEGQGYHFAVYNKTLDPPYVQFDFYGTGIEFFGFWGYVGSGTKVSGGPGSTSIFVSGATYSGPQDIIFSGMSLSRAMDSAQPVSIGIIKDLPAGFYSVGLRVTGGTVSFTHAVIDAEFGATQSTMEVTRRNAVIVSPVKTTDLGELVRNDDFGNWTGAGWTVNADRRVLGTDKLNDSVLIDLGTGNYWMDLKGSRGTFASFFRYEISPAPPMLYERLTTLRAYSPWEVRNVSLLATTLDPAVRYTLSVTNLLNDGFDTGYEGLNKMMNWLELSSLELWNQHAGPSPAKEPPIAAIVGGTLGSVILCVVVGATAWWYMCGRRRRRRTISPEDNFEIDESPVAVSTPYVSPRKSVWVSADYGHCIRQWQNLVLPVPVITDLTGALDGASPEQARIHGEPPHVRLIGRQLRRPSEAPRAGTTPIELRPLLH